MISEQNSINFLFSGSAYFATLFKNTARNSFVIMNDEGVIVAINHAFTNSFGYEPGDIIGKNVALLFTEEDQEKGLPQQELCAVLSKGNGSDNNYLVSK